MAEKRMFTKKITESDAFLDMPASSQMLYFHLNMAADDEGFVNNPKKIQRMCGASDDDLKLLLLKSFIISFDSGIIVIKHWKMHNYIQSDRFKATDYQEERAMLSVKENKSYTVNGHNLDTKCIQDVSVDKNSIDKNSIDIYNAQNDAQNDAQFETLWCAYPRKKDKARARSCYNARLKDGWKHEELMQAVENYALECKKDRTETKYIKHPSTFLSASTPFTDYIRKGETYGSGMEGHVEGNALSDAELDRIGQCTDEDAELSAMFG